VKSLSLSYPSDGAVEFSCELVYAGGTITAV
jgi:hypothetical protein